MASLSSQKMLKVDIDTTLTLAHPSYLCHQHSSSSSSTSSSKLVEDSSSESRDMATSNSWTEEEWPLQHCTNTDSKEHVVGWPPVKSFRKSLSPHEKYEDDSYGLFKHKGNLPIIHQNGQHIESPIFVKVHMEGMHFGRKLDLNAYDDYLGLYLALEDMFMLPPFGLVGGREKNSIYEDSHRFEINNHNKLFNFHKCVFTYEDKQGDWMMVGDLPWDMFVFIVKRIRIMKGSNGS